MTTARLGLWLLALGLGCSTRGGYAEPGPLSANASPPPPASVQSSGALQTSPASGRQGEGPIAVNAGGAQVAENHAGRGQARTPATECARDSDCVAATCCHADACVAAARAPACGSMACTADCVPNSLDCGQGSCACVSGRCGIIRARAR